MTRRQIRLRAVRREEIDLRRLAAALSALAAETDRRNSDEQTTKPAKRRAA